MTGVMQLARISTVRLSRNYQIYTGTGTTHSINRLVMEGSMSKTVAHWIYQDEKRQSHILVEIIPRE